MTKSKPITIKPYVSPLASIIRCDSRSMLGSVLSRVRSSHDPVFVYDKSDDFVGLISPFETIFSSNYPYSTKVSSISFSPPNITKEAPVYQVAKHMLASKVYTLPVYDKEGEMEGVVYARDILEEIITNSSLLEFVSSKIEPHTPITAPITAVVKDVFNEFKEKGVSRMVLVDAEGDLAGIVTRGDMMQAMIKPTDKMRFPNEGSRVGHRSLGGEKKTRKTEPVTQYYTALVDTLLDSTPIPEIVKHLIISPHDSIVLVNKSNKPTGFLSTRDILQAFTELRPVESTHIMIKKPGTAVSDEQLKKVTDYLDLFAKKLSKRMDIEKIEVTSQEPKNTAGKTKKFNVKLIVIPVAGNPLVAETKERNFFDGVREAAALIEKQRRRSGLSKEETQES